MRALAFVVLVACGGATTTATVSVAPLPTPTTTQQTPPPVATQTPTPPPPQTGIHFGGGDGSSIEKAIVILGAKGEMDGVAAEYDYLEAHGMHRSDVGSQSLLNHGKRSYDMLQVRTPQGSRDIYFDITDYFGKL